MGFTPKSRSAARPFEWRVVLCGSMSAYGEMLQVRKALSRSGVSSIVPIAEDGIREQMSEDEFAVFKGRVSYRHLMKIRHPSTFAVLAINRDKLGVRDYIGPNTFAEIAVAFAQSKRIYLYQGIPKMYEDELTAWGAIPLNGEVLRLTRDMRAFVNIQTAQLSLF